MYCTFPTSQQGSFLRQENPHRCLFELLNHTFNKKKEDFIPLLKIKGNGDK